MEIKKATRQGVKPLIGLFAESGCGKTYSALLLARGLVGPNGKIVMIDTESGRGSLYADVLPGGYEVLELRDNFSPANYIQAIQMVEKSGAGIGIIDSASHEWEGLGGVLDMASKIEAEKGKSLNVWRMPKMEHSKFMLALLQSSLPWICCLRAKHKTRQTKNQGRTEIVKDDFTTPLTSDDFIFEMVAHGEILPDHSFRLTKANHPDLRQCLPNNEPMAIRHGELLAKWCASPGGPGTSQAAVDPEIKRLKKQLWELTKPKHDGKLPNLEFWLIGEGILSDTEDIETVTAQRLSEIIQAVQARINSPQP